MIFHSREGQLNRVVIGGVERQKFVPHTPRFQCQQLKYVLLDDLPGLNECQDLGMLVDSTVVHDNDRILLWEGAHVV
jgi:hypothetical protein